MSGTVQDEVLTEVHAVLAEQLGERVDADETEIIASGLVDSLAFVDLILKLEERFDISIDMESLEFQDFETPRAIAALVTRQRR